MHDWSFEQSTEDDLDEKKSSAFVKDQGEVDRAKGFFGFFKSVNDDARGAILKKGLEDAVAILDEASLIQNGIIMDDLLKRLNKLKPTGKYEMMTPDVFIMTGQELQKMAGKSYDEDWRQSTAIRMLGAFLESKVGRSKDAQRVHKVLGDLISSHEN